MSEPRVAVVMGSDSDWPVMSAAVEACREFAIGLGRANGERTEELARQLHDRLLSLKRPEAAMLRRNMEQGRGLGNATEGGGGEGPVASPTRDA